jgi:diguanylate cyclase (GGDEF)-like protein
VSAASPPPLHRPSPTTVTPPKRWPWLALVLVVGIAAIGALVILHAREQHARRAETQATLFATELRDSVREITLFGNAIPPAQMARALGPVIAATAQTANARVARLADLLSDDQDVMRLRVQLARIARIAQSDRSPVLFSDQLSLAAATMADDADAIAAEQHHHATWAARETIAGGALAIALSLSIVGLALQRASRLVVRAGRRQARVLQELADHDPLTGLANRRGLQRALRRAEGSTVLVGIDLDGFKTVNDMRGHDAGDAVLTEVGDRLRRNLLDGDVAARLGGDEFAVLMHGTADEAMLTAHRLLAVLGEPYDVDGGSVFLSASLGVADTGELIRDADLALRYAKQRGKNRVERYQVRYDELLRRRGTLESELRHAIDRDQLRLVFQPVVALPSMRPVGAEALLRWHHPTLGAVRPDEFIPVAEEAGLISRLGSWVLRTATEQLAQWLASGYDVWCSVNMSPKELHAADYAAQVADVLDEFGVPPQRLVLEVTEHAVATDMDELISRLTELRATGVRIALDDFGAGYSSLGQLRNLPIDILKIDHALVAEPESRTGTAAPLVDVVVRLGHRLGLEVLAEGIGTPAQRGVVEEAGCRLGQGSLFGWGVPAEHFEAQLNTLRSSAARPVPAQRSAPPAIAAGPARSQLISLGPGMKQLRALLPTDPAFEPRVSDQDVGSFDSTPEMGQG